MDDTAILPEEGEEEEMSRTFLKQRDTAVLSAMKWLVQFCEWMIILIIDPFGFLVSTWGTQSH